jgi:UDP-3-O-[3-hydroxymyristoyl] glucosamine N-acyltransferase
MKLNPTQTLASINALISAEMKGPEGHVISGINEIHKVQSGDLVFVDHPKYYQKALDSAAHTILIDSADVEVPEGKALLVSADPFADYNFLTKHFSPLVLWTDTISGDLSVGKDSMIFPGVVIGKNVTVGDQCVIHAGVVIHDNTTIGDRVTIQANAVIGNDAFYYNNRKEGRVRMHSCGEVIIEDDAEIGTACTISKGVSGDTRIGKRTKLDSQVHVGHDTVIGEDCLIAAQCGIAGCVTIEDGVTLWGQVGIPSNVTIGKGAELLGKSGPFQSVEGGKTYFGVPCVERRQAFREMAMIKKLPELFENRK